MARSTAPTPLDLLSLPGHSIRRMHQIAVAIFLDETADFGITPVQFAALHAVVQQPGVDQRTLAKTIGFDTSTIGGVVDRLEARGLMQRNASTSDRRVRQLTITPEGQALLTAVMPAMLAAQKRMLAPLPAAQRKEFLRMLAVLVDANNELSRAPSDVA
jgi:MarR family transcriptional regulator, lower aerobic nicotinate degradation pathway regulator